MIDLAEGGPTARDLLTLWNAADRDELELVVGTITASENQPRDKAPSFPAFTQLLSRAGLAEVRMLPTMAVWGVTFWNQGLWAGEEMQELERRIREILAPGFDLEDKSDYRRWRNTTCDVLTVWTHIWHETDYLATNDRRMLRKAEQLAELGANLKSPAELVDLLVGA